MSARQQIKAAVSVNRELIALYWDIGKALVVRQLRHKWGDRVIDRLAEDLAREFPEMKGFSRHNLYRMSAFYLAYSEEVLIVAQPVLQLPQSMVKQLVAELEEKNLPQAVGEIPWGHNVMLLQKLRDPLLRLWYARKTIEHGWSRAMLVHQIETSLHKREGRAITNFQRTLPPPQSDLAQQTLKDPYNLDFLTLSADAREHELEKGLLDHIQKFLLELGVGFAFVGRQYHIEVDSEDFYIDLLFYHVYLRCYVVIDLKVEPLKPEFAGKMNFYLSAVDDYLRACRPEGPWTTRRVEEAVWSE